MVRFPRWYQALMALLLHFVRPEAGVRRRLVRRGVLSGWAAAQRRAFELMLVRYAPDVVLEADAGLQALGVPGSARGREEMARVVVEVWEVFDRFEITPTAALDLGNSLIVLGAQRVHGPGSGIELESEFAQLLTIERGLVAHEREFYSWDDALRAAGLDPATLELPGRP
jgi:hypothetical protein